MGMTEVAWQWSESLQGVVESMFNFILDIELLTGSEWINTLKLNMNCASLRTAPDLSRETSEENTSKFVGKILLHSLGYCIP